MSISFEAVSAKYLTAKKLSGGTRKEYKSTTWGNGVDVDEINRSHIRDFLDWVHDQADKNGGSNPGRTANKARENLRAIMSWAWENDYVVKLPAFPKPIPQRDVAGRHYLTKPDLNALYFATYKLHIFLLLPAQAFVANHLATYKKFPPRQERGSFALDDVLTKLQESSNK